MQSFIIQISLKSSYPRRCGLERMVACTEPYGASHKASRQSTSQPIGNRAATRLLGYQNNCGENRTQEDSSAECLNKRQLKVYVSRTINRKNNTRQRNDSKGCKGPVLFPVFLFQSKKWRGISVGIVEVLRKAIMNNFVLWVWVNTSYTSSQTMLQVQSEEWRYEFAKVALVCFSRRI